MPVIKRCGVSYSSYPEYEKLCPANHWTSIDPSRMTGLLSPNLLRKSPSILLAHSAFSGQSYIGAFVNRLDREDTAIDQELYVFKFAHETPTAEGRVMFHGNWSGRTIHTGIAFFQAIDASGIKAANPLPTMPTGNSGPIDTLDVHYQNLVQSALQHWFK
jgi:hypothetical protein